MENQVRSTEQKRFLDIVREHLDLEARENNLKKKTIEKHDYQYNNLENFLLFTAQASITVDRVRVRHMEAFKEWIYENTTTNSKSHVSRHLRLCREALHHAVRKEYIEYNCLTSVQLKRDADKSVVSLRAVEVHKFSLYRAGRNTWRIVLDLFLFQCYTGLSYMDLWLFELEDDRITTESGRVFYVTWVTHSLGRGKTSRFYWAELIPEAKEILKRYNGELPRMHNQTYNKIIKRIAKELGIKKHLTTHIGRKTFANIMKSKGYSTPAIAEMLGNTEEVTRKHYLEQAKDCIVIEISRVNRWDSIRPGIAS